MGSIVRYCWHLVKLQRVDDAGLMGADCVASTMSVAALFDQNRKVFLLTSCFACVRFRVSYLTLVFGPLLTAPLNGTVTGAVKRGSEATVTRRHHHSNNTTRSLYER